MNNRLMTHQKVKITLEINAQINVITNININHNVLKLFYTGI